MTRPLIQQRKYSTAKIILFVSILLIFSVFIKFFIYDWEIHLYNLLDKKYKWIWESKGILILFFFSIYLVYTNTKSSLKHLKDFLKEVAILSYSVFIKILMFLFNLLTTTFNTNRKLGFLYIYFIWYLFRKFRFVFFKIITFTTLITILLFYESIILNYFSIAIAFHFIVYTIIIRIAELNNFKNSLGISYKNEDYSKFHDNKYFEWIKKLKPEQLEKIKELSLSLALFLTEFRERNLKILGALIYNSYLMALVLLSYTFIYYNIYLLDQSTFIIENNGEFLDFIFYSFETINFISYSGIKQNNVFVNIFNLLSSISYALLFFMPVLVFFPVVKRKYELGMDEIIKYLNKIGNSEFD